MKAIQVMRDVVVMVAFVLLGSIAGYACSAQQRADAKTALKLADEACDVLVLLEDDATWVCVPVDKLEAAARVVLNNKSSVRVELPDGPRVRPARSVVLSGESKHFELVAPAGKLELVDAGEEGGDR